LGTLIPFPQRWHTSNFRIMNHGNSRLSCTATQSHRGTEKRHSRWRIQNRLIREGLRWVGTYVSATPCHFTFRLCGNIPATPQKNNRLMRSTGTAIPESFGFPRSVALHCFYRIHVLCPPQLFGALLSLGVNLPDEPQFP